MEKAVNSAGTPLSTPLHSLPRFMAAFCENEKMESIIEFPLCLAAKVAGRARLPSPEFCTNFMRHSGIKTGLESDHGMRLNCLALTLLGRAFK